MDRFHNLGRHRLLWDRSPATRVPQTSGYSRDVNRRAGALLVELYRLVLQRVVRRAEQNSSALLRRMEVFRMSETRWQSREMHVPVEARARVDALAQRQSGLRVLRPRAHAIEFRGLSVPAAALQVSSRGQAIAPLHDFQTLRVRLPL